MTPSYAIREAHGERRLHLQPSCGNVQPTWESLRSSNAPRAGKMRIFSPRRPDRSARIAASCSTSENGSTRITKSANRSVRIISQNTRSSQELTSIVRARASGSVQVSPAPLAAFFSFWDRSDPAVPRRAGARRRVKAGAALSRLSAVADLRRKMADAPAGEQPESQETPPVGRGVSATAGSRLHWSGPAACPEESEQRRALVGRARTGECRPERPDGVSLEA